MYLSLLLTLYLLHLSFVVRALGHHDWSNQTLCSANSFQIANNGTDSTIWPWQTYRSSNATPPMLQINTTGKNLSPGLLFFTPFDGSSTPGAKEQVLIVMTDKGDLVWNGPEQHNADLRVQTFNDEPVLVYWSGEGTAGTSLAVGHGYGEIVVLDKSYQVTHTVCPNLDITLPPGATARCAVDVHEALITSRDTMLFTAYNTTPFDLSSIGGPRNGWALDSLVFEVNITTGEVLFEWSPLRHLPLNSTHYPLNGAGVNASVPFDAFHVNSIQLIDGGHYLINSRHTWSTYLVDTDGKIIWEINGLDGGDFGKLPEGASFVCFCLFALHLTATVPFAHVCLQTLICSTPSPGNTMPAFPPSTRLLRSSRGSGTITTSSPLRTTCDLARVSSYRSISLPLETPHQR